MNRRTFVKSLPAIGAGVVAAGAAKPVIPSLQPYQEVILYGGNRSGKTNWAWETSGTIYQTGDVVTNKNLSKGGLGKWVCRDDERQR